MRHTRILLYAITLSALLGVGVLAQSQGGVFLPASDYVVSGTWTFLGTVVQSGASAFGAVTGTSFNKVAITAPASSATLTLATGKTFTVNNSVTLAGTDSTTMTFPATSANIASGVGASYKVARGTITLDGTNPSSAATGLTTVVSCSVSGPAAAAIPTDDPMGASPFINTTNLDIYAWKTDGSDPTPVASTDNTAVFYWTCVGT